MTEPEEMNPYQSPRAAPLSPLQRRNGEKLVVISTFDSSFDAQRFCEELTLNGIEACVDEDQMKGIGAAFGGVVFPFPVGVLVLESQKQEALVVKQTWDSSKSDSTDQTPEWTCGCGETVDAGFDVCWNCAAERGGSPK